MVLRVLNKEVTGWCGAADASKLNKYPEMAAAEMNLAHAFFCAIEILEDIRGGNKMGEKQIELDYE